MKSKPDSHSEYMWVNAAGIRRKEHVLIWGGLADEPLQNNKNKEKTMKVLKIVLALALCGAVAVLALRKTASTEVLEKVVNVAK